MVTAEDEEVFRIFNLICQEQADGLKGLLASVDVISEEEIVCFRWEASILKQAEKIVILAVDITTYL